MDEIENISHSACFTCKSDSIYNYFLFIRFSAFRYVHRHDLQLRVFWVYSMVFVFPLIIVKYVFLMHWCLHMMHSTIQWLRMLSKAQHDRNNPTIHNQGGGHVGNAYELRTIAARKDGRMHNKQQLNKILNIALCLFTISFKTYRLKYMSSKNVPILNVIICDVSVQNSHAIVYMNSIHFHNIRICFVIWAPGFRNKCMILSLQITSILATFMMSKDAKSINIHV